MSDVSDSSDVTPADASADDIARVIGDEAPSSERILNQDEIDSLLGFDMSEDDNADRTGIRAIINLRGRNDDLSWWKNETRIAEARGIAHLDAMLDSRHLPTANMLARLLDCFDAAPRPFMLKCSGGQDRTSFAAALYLIHRSGWNAMAEAQAQFARFPYLHFPKKHQRWLKPFLDFAAEDADGLDLAAWIAEHCS